MTLQAGARMSLLQGMIQGNEPSLRGLAVHRLRQDAAGALPAPGIFPQKGERPPFILLGELMTKEGLRRVIVFDQIWMFIPAGPHVWPGASSIRIKQQTSPSDDCADDHAGGVPSEEWDAIGHVLMPAVRACLSQDIETGWHNAGDACMHAEPICEALSLYHLLLSRDTKETHNLTGLSKQIFCGL